MVFGGTLEQAPGATSPPQNGARPAGHAMKQIGWLLAWAVVFCDIGTSVYYVPGILYHHVGNLAPYFVLLATVGFLLLAQKYGRGLLAQPGGGRRGHRRPQGVRALVGGAGRDPDHDRLLPHLRHLVGQRVRIPRVDLPEPAAATWRSSPAAGSSCSACSTSWGSGRAPSVALAFALASLVANLAVVIVALVGFHSGNLHVLEAAATQFKSLPPRMIMIGFAGSWLAFSGLESISQLSPALKLPTKKTVRYAMYAVVGTIVITSPTLTALSIAVIPDAMKAAGTDSFISDLAFTSQGPGCRSMSWRRPPRCCCSPPTRP